MAELRNYYNDIRFLVDAMKDAETRFLWMPREVSPKGHYDIVTNIDKEIEKCISKLIKKHYPNDVIIGEEFSPDEVLPDTVCWTIDPIDGTVNFSRNIPSYGIQMSLIINKEIQASAIYLPEVDLMYWAIKGHGAYSSFDNDTTGKKATVHKKAVIDSAIISIGDFSHSNDELRMREIKAISYLSDKVLKIRMWGAACVDFASIAGMMTDGYIVFSRNLWDICPGILICKEAGAIVTNAEGQPFKLGDDCVVVAANKKIHEELLNSIALSRY